MWTHQQLGQTPWSRGRSRDRSAQQSSVGQTYGSHLNSAGVSTPAPLQLRITAPEPPAESIPTDKKRDGQERDGSGERWFATASAAEVPALSPKDKERRQPSGASQNNRRTVAARKIRREVSGRREEGGEAEQAAHRRRRSPPRTAARSSHAAAKSPRRTRTRAPRRLLAVARGRTGARRSGPAPRRREAGRAAAPVTSCAGSCARRCTMTRCTSSLRALTWLDLFLDLLG